ncbi:MAG: hypothetical protein BWY04_01387 [candidate division CPR1 bacterium ADurb.Bin160]|uniref:Uncharacterized protein n=1 Tax=candidate division CPR1 bacterium ADurb.Bin160 TaxID=1852826 RepID=A0A1V5ZJT2_9BACT|nr:MAG: hypothetical protein BWY04_01387 [candidate division CPR1 bacterium ADurb.Bin160]
MEAIHISEISNRENILKNGLVPSKVILDHHLESFYNCGYLEHNEDKMLYMWVDSEKNEKFIKDMMYCKMWLTPRNKYSIKLNDYVEWDKIDMINLYPYNSMVFDVYKINNPSNVVKNNEFHYHIQIPSDDVTNSTYEMDDNYAHEDKPLIFSKISECNVEIIGQAKVWLDKNNKIQTEIYKSVRY